MNLLNNVRLLILLVLVLASAISLIVPLFSSISGVFIGSVSQDANCVGVVAGSRLSQVRGRRVNSLEDFSNAIIEVKTGDFVTLVVDGRPGSCVALSDRNLGFEVSSSTATSFVDLGIDLGGGTAYSYSVEGNASIASVESLVERRAQTFGFQDLTAKVENSKIKIVTSSSRHPEELLYPGKVEVRLLGNFKIQNGTGKFFVGDKESGFTISNGSLVLSEAGRSYSPGSVFVVNDTKIYYVNSTATAAVIEIVVFDNSGVAGVIPQRSSLKYIQQAGIYQYQILVSVTSDAGAQFQKIGLKMPTTILSGDIAIDGFIVFAFDGREIGRLSVPVTFVRTPIANIGISGFATTNEQAKADMLKVLAALESGILGSKLVLVEQERVAPTMKDFAVLVLLGMAAAAFLLTVLAGAIRYKKSKAGSYAFVLLLAVLLVTLGIIRLELSLSGLNFVVGMNVVYAIAISFLLFPIQFIFSAEKIIRAKELSLRIGYKKLIGAKSFIYLLTIVAAIAASLLYDRPFAIFLFFATVLDLILINSIREKSLRSS